jgi:hypothetical protein
MTSDELSSLLEKAVEGLVTPKEVAEAAENLAASTSPREQRILLRVLGESGALDFRDSVEALLHTDNAVVASAALQVLCEDWNLTSEYLDFIRPLIATEAGSRHRREDEDQANLRTTAIQAAGEYLRQERDSDLLSVLLHVFENDTEDVFVREEAYSALVRAVGLDWPPTTSLGFRFETDVDRTVIERVRERLGSER